MSQPLPSSEQPASFKTGSLSQRYRYPRVLCIPMCTHVTRNISVPSKRISVTTKEWLNGDSCYILNIPCFSDIPVFFKEQGINPQKAMTSRKKYSVYWIMKLSTLSRSWVVTVITLITGDNKIPSDVSMKIHKTRGYPYHCGVHVTLG